MTDQPKPAFDREAARRRCEAATPGLWEYFAGSILPPDSEQGHFEHEEPDWIEWIQNGRPYLKMEADGMLMASAFTDLPAAIALLDRQDAEMAKLTQRAEAAERLIRCAFNEQKEAPCVSCGKLVPRCDWDSHWESCEHPNGAMLEHRELAVKLATAITEQERLRRSLQQITMLEGWEWPQAFQIARDTLNPPQPATPERPCGECGSSVALDGDTVVIDQPANGSQAKQNATDDPPGLRQALLRIPHEIRTWIVARLADGSDAEIRIATLEADLATAIAGQERLRGIITEAAEAVEELELYDADCADERARGIALQELSTATHRLAEAMRKDGGAK